MVANMGVLEEIGKYMWKKSYPIKRFFVRNPPAPYFWSNEDTTKRAWQAINRSV